MTNAVFETIDDFDDIASVNYYAYEVAAGADPVELLEQMRPASRDNARSPMQWDSSASSGFSTGEPWQRVNPDHTTIDAAVDGVDAGDCGGLLAEPDGSRWSAAELLLGNYDAPTAGLPLTLCPWECRIYRRHAKA